MKRALIFFRVCSFVVLIIGTGNGSRAQEPQFSQFYASPLYLNPALTGNTRKWRVASNYRNQWPRVPGYVSYTFSYDQRLPAFNSGLGLLFIRDEASSGGLTYTNIGGLYSYRLKISNKKRINWGVRFSYSNMNLDYSKLVFVDQVLRSESSTLENFDNVKSTYFDISSGMVYDTDKYWIGIALDHLNRPNQSFLGNKNKASIKASLHGGVHLIERKHSTKKTILSRLTIAVNYKAQLKWDQLDVGVYYRRKIIIAGMWYRGIPLLKSYKPGYGNHDALVLLFGAQLQDFIIGYSYDLTISRLISRTGGAHEISLTYQFGSSAHGKNIKRAKMIPCAKFIGVEF